MSDDQRFDKDEVDDPLARIRARFEQASERILSGTDDVEVPLREPPRDPSPVSTMSADPAPFDDFGEIDIKDDANFSLDFEHGVSGSDAQRPPAASSSVSELLDEHVDLVANLAMVREEAPNRSVPVVDPDRHQKHRTRGRVDVNVPEPEEVHVADEPGVEDLPVPKETIAAKVMKARRTEPGEAAARPRPQAPETGDAESGSRRGLALVAAVLVVAGAVAGYFLAASPSGGGPTDTTAAAVVTTQPAPATPGEAAAVALEAFGFTDLQVEVDENGVATIVGTVRTARERDIAMEIVTEIDGVAEVATDIVYDINRDPTAVRADVDSLALKVNHPLTFVYADGIVNVAGIVPKTAVESGELGEDGTLERKLTDISGVEEVRFDLTLRGNPRRLASNIAELLTTGPILYDEETGERLPESDATLDAITALMADEPGITISVAVRGDDAEDEDLLLLAEQRRDAIVTYLVDAGVDPGLIDTVLVATMQPTTLDLPSEVLIEVVDS
jgi:hypothetical protein